MKIYNNSDFFEMFHCFLAIDNTSARRNNRIFCLYITIYLIFDF